MSKTPSTKAKKRRTGRSRASLSGIKHVSEIGAQPGILVQHGKVEAPKIQVFAYGADEFIEIFVSDVDEVAALRAKHPVLWVNVIGLGDVEQIGQFGEKFSLHRLALEDVVNVHQRPKAEEYGDHIFIVARMLHLDDMSDSEQVSMFMGSDFLLTFQERTGDCFDGVRKRLRAGGNRIRSSPPDYLCYALIDAIIDGYFPVLERYGEILEDLEDEVVGGPEPKHIQILHEKKRDLLMMRRAIWPHREMINSLIRDEHTLFSDATRVYLRDCYDHAVQLMDIVETYREIASGLIDVYISTVGAKMNEIMKVLTIIATIFMPLGFLAGLYGMNFDPEASPWNMPELGLRYGYPVALLVMFLLAAGMVYCFWRIGWIGKGPRRRV